jgi:hypothetical protein
MSAPSWLSLLIAVMGAIPPWVGPLIGVVVGFSLNIVYEHRRKVWTTPALKIDCTTAPRNIGGVNNPNQKAVYMKFRVQNTRNGTVARNVRAYLIGLYDVRSTQVMTEDLILDTFQLPWEGGDFDPRDIPSGHSYYGDLVHFSKDTENSEWLFRTKPNDIGNKNHKGTYQFVVLVAGDNATHAIGRINVDCSGGWKNARPYDVNPPK